MISSRGLGMILVLLIVAGIGVACVPPTPVSVPTALPMPSSSATLPTPGLAPTSRPVATVTPSPEPAPPLPYVVGSVSLLDLPGQGRSPQDLAAVGDRIYVANSNTGNVSLIEDGCVVAVVPVGPQPIAIVAESAGRRVYVLDGREARVAVLEHDTVVDGWAVPAGSSSLELVGDTLWVGTGDGHLLGLGADDGLETTAIALSESQPVLRVLANPLDPTKMAAVTYGRVHLVDRGLGVETAVAEMGIWRVLAYDPAGDRLYAGVYDGDTNTHRLLVLAADDLSVRDEVELPSAPRAVLADAETERIYVALGTD
ncbi:MAG: hypothetical protein ACP5G7_08995, partial [Anaerolineae bacterium]